MIESCGQSRLRVALGILWNVWSTIGDRQISHNDGMRRLWLLFAQTVTILLAVWFAVATLQPQWLHQASEAAQPALITPSTDLSPAADPAADRLPGLSAAVAKAAPAVVSINTHTLMRQHPGSDPWFRFFFGDSAMPEQSGLGSGVIMSSSGIILTNNHVIENADSIEVVLADNRQVTARILGTDPESDLAVLQIKLDELPQALIGDSNKLRVGDAVLAIGNPFGVGQTVTSGIVSALQRNQLGINTFEDFIQTDAAINPGNSGGALVDARGRLMGINTAIYSRTGGNLGIGFAIPIDTALHVMNSILEHGRVVRGWIGVEPRDLTPDLARMFRTDSQSGVIVTGVLRNSPAARGGLLPGDIITRVGDQTVVTARELLAATTALQPGEPVKISLERRAEAMVLEITPGQRPPVRRAQR